MTFIFLIIFIIIISLGINEIENRSNNKRKCDYHDWAVNSDLKALQCSKCRKIAKNE